MSTSEEEAVFGVSIPTASGARDACDYMESYLDNLGFKRSTKTFMTKAMSGYWHWVPKRSGKLPGNLDEIDPRWIDDGGLQDISALIDVGEPRLKRLNYVFDQFEGDLIDIDEGNWVIFGTARGRKAYGSDPAFGTVASPYTIQYTARDDSLEVTLGCKWSGWDVSAPDSPMQLEQDMSLPKVVMIARKELNFGCGRFSPGNYYYLS